MSTKIDCEHDIIEVTRPMDRFYQGICDKCGARFIGPEVGPYRRVAITQVGWHFDKESTEKARLRQRGEPCQQAG